MIIPPQLFKDNEAKVRVDEIDRLKYPRRLTERTLTLGGVPQGFPPRAAAEMFLRFAVEGGCETIVVLHGANKTEFKTRELNDNLNKFPFHGGSGGSPLELQAVGSWFDTTRKLWVVPRGYKAKGSEDDPEK